ncbi:MAG: RICIN domain-containing protein [Burkholderiales bacterium]|nr:RICIN domain-containing protein [Burkholderiales bacterium]
MRDFQTFTGQALAVAASLLLLSACGGGDDDNGAATPTTTTTTSAGSTTTTTVTTTTTTTAAPSFQAAQLVVQHSGHCLSVAGSTAGSPATQQVCNVTAPEQRWKAVPVGADIRIQNNSSNLCLGVANGNMTPAAAVSQIACTGDAFALWTLRPSGTPGQFNIVAKHSGQCLDVFGSDQAPGTGAIQFTCSTANQANQRWVVSGQ